MHEVDMTRSLVLTLRDWWESQPDRPHISRVHLRVGDFTCVEPMGLVFAFDAYKEGTFLAAAELAIESVPLVAFCHACQSDYRPEVGLHYACPTCGAPMEDIRSGRELKISHIEYQNAQQETVTGQLVMA
jgi:hydrogenase nickel incorporation protein HypA/HybF